MNTYMSKKIVKLFVILIFFIGYGQRGNAQGGVASVPYFCDFENAMERSQWIFRNGTQTNKWYVDTAVNNGGSYSLYVSNDGGINNEYAPANASSVWAYRQVALGQGLYNVSYDWRAQGYTNTHYMRAYLVPQAQFNGTAGSSTGFQISGSPNGWIPINATYPTGALMNQQSRWQNVYIGNVQITTPGNYYLVFGWVNSSTSVSNTNPPAAVDNIQITTATCPRPDNLSVMATSATGNATVSWTENGNATHWVLEYSRSSAFHSPTVINLEYPTNVNQTAFNNYEYRMAGFQPYTSYYFRIRAVCDTGVSTGDSSMTSVVFNFRFCPSNVGCIDFTNLTGPNCVCTWGRASYTELTNGGWGSYAGPYENTGVVDYGPRAYGYPSNQQASRHTVHTDATAMDSLSNYQLPIIPAGECAAVRLGCEYGSYFCQSISYDFVVDTNVSDIVVLKYAIVVYNPGHPSNQQPRFTMQLLDSANTLIDPVCGVADFNATNAATDANQPGSPWHSGLGYGVYYRDWTPVGIEVSRYHGQRIKVRLTTFNCGQGGSNHFLYAYFTLGCTKGRITSTTCGGGSVSTTLSAPSGFNYRWYTASNPGVTISTQQTVTVQLDSTMYYCEVSFVDNPNCHFTMSTLATLRYPKAAFVGTTSTDSCIYRLRLRNTSHITNDPVADTLNIGPCESYFWDFGDGQTSTAENPTVEYSMPGTYTVKLIAKINNGECTDTITQRFTFRPPLSSHIIAPRRVCYGDTAFLRAATPNYVEYRWSTGYNRDSLYVVPDSTTVYTLVARDSIGCVDSMRVVVGVTDCHITDTTCRNERYVSYGFSLPANTIRQFADTTVVFERHTRSSFGVDSVTTLHLLILDTNEVVTYDTFCYGDPYSFYNIPLTRGGRYSQRFTNQHGCDSIIYLELEELPRPTLELFHSYVPCFNYPVTLIANRTGGDWIRWSSSPNDTSMSGYETQDTLVVKPHERTIYTAVTGPDNYPCTTSAQTIVNLETDLKAYIHTSQEAANYGNMQVIFSDRSTDNTGRRWYLRDFNLPVGTGENYVYTFKANEDSVTVILVAYIEGTECLDTTSVTIPLFKDGIWVPT
ncbi:MAG: PKD domain-containing protein, partial [Bacteroidales bacterium]|nr:PKD domain-containing protein [Bacteroidales bacterium]